jgi:glycosyltransferase involved in cell wall biosynthesis
MNILLISHYAGSLKHGMEYRPYYLAREWVRMGHHPVIVASSISHIRTQNPQLQKSIRLDSTDGIPYIWLKTPGYSGNGVRRVLNMFAFAALLRAHSNWIVRTFNPDLVIASSPHPFIIFPAQYIARRCHARLVYEVRDLWPLTLTELGGISSRHPFIMLMQRTEHYAHRAAHRVVSLLPEAAGYMVRHGMEPDKYIYVPNGIDVDEWSPQKTPLPREHIALLRELRSQNKFILGYTGGHGVSNSLEHLVHSGAILKGSPVAFVLVGSGPQKSGLQKLASETNCNNIFFLPSIPKTSIPEILSLIDAAYIGWQKKPIYCFGISPNKLMDYMMAAKPVIHSTEAANDLVAVAGCGISVPPEDPGAIAQAVRSLMALNELERRNMGRRGREYVMANHDYRVLAKKFLELVMH